MQNSARIQSIVQQLVDALVDEITAEVRMRTGTPVSTPQTTLPDWDSMNSFSSSAPSDDQPAATVAPTPKFETPDFDQLLKDLEELRKPLKNSAPQVQDAEVVSSPQTDSFALPSFDAPSAPKNMPSDSKPFSGLSGASDLLKRVTGK